MVRESLWKGDVGVFPLLGTRGVTDDDGNGTVGGERNSRGIHRRSLTVNVQLPHNISEERVGTSTGGGDSHSTSTSILGQHNQRLIVFQIVLLLNQIDLVEILILIKINAVE